MAKRKRSPSKVSLKTLAAAVKKRSCAWATRQIWPSPENVIEPGVRHGGSLADGRYYCFFKTARVLPEDEEIEVDMQCVEINGQGSRAVTLCLRSLRELDTLITTRPANENTAAAAQRSRKSIEAASPKTETEATSKKRPASAAATKSGAKDEDAEGDDKDFQQQTHALRQRCMAEASIPDLDGLSSWERLVGSFVATWARDRLRARPLLLRGTASKTRAALCAARETGRSVLIITRDNLTDHWLLQGAFMDMEVRSCGSAESLRDALSRSPTCCVLGLFSLQLATIQDELSAATSFPLLIFDERCHLCALPHVAMQRSAMHLILLSDLDGQRLADCRQYNSKLALLLDVNRLMILPPLPVHLHFASSTPEQMLVVRALRLHRLSLPTTLPHQVRDTATKTVEVLARTLRNAFRPKRRREWTRYAEALGCLGAAFPDEKSVLGKYCFGCLDCFGEILSTRPGCCHWLCLVCAAKPVCPLCARCEGGAIRQREKVLTARLTYTAIPTAITETLQTYSIVTIGGEEEAVVSLRRPTTWKTLSAAVEATAGPAEGRYLAQEEEEDELMGSHFLRPGASLVLQCRSPGCGLLLDLAAFYKTMRPRERTVVVLSVRGPWVVAAEELHRVCQLWGIETRTGNSSPWGPDLSSWRQKEFLLVDAARACAYDFEGAHRVLFIGCDAICQVVMTLLEQRRRSQQHGVEVHTLLQDKAYKNLHGVSTLQELQKRLKATGAHH